MEQPGGDSGTEEVYVWILPNGHIYLLHLLSTCGRSGSVVFVFFAAVLAKHATRQTGGDLQSLLAGHCGRIYNAANTRTVSIDRWER